MDRFVPFRLSGAHSLAPALAELRRAGVIRILSPFGAVLAGTLPLGIDLPGSDADVLCALPSAERFRAAVQAFRRHPGFGLQRSERSGRATWICRFTAGALPVEVFAQAGPLTSQRGYRHLLVEHRLLSFGGEPLRERVMTQRRAGAKTEPAFAQLLGLAGDPFVAMAELAAAPDARLRRLVRESLG